jgi:amino acid permease
MKSLLKNLGLILMIIGAAILVGVFFAGSAAINDNGVLGGSAALIVIGLIVYIVLNKRIVD